MKPPICSICGKDFRKDIGSGGQVGFALSDKEKAINAKFKESGMTGHPEGLHWFCEKHIEQGIKFKDLAWSQARKKILKKVGLFERIEMFFKQVLPL